MCKDCFCNYGYIERFSSSVDQQVMKDNFPLIMSGMHQKNQLDEQFRRDENLTAKAPETRTSEMSLDGKFHCIKYLLAEKWNFWIFLDLWNLMKETSNRTKQIKKSASSVWLSLFVGSSMTLINAHEQAQHHATQYLHKYSTNFEPSRIRWSTYDSEHWTFSSVFSHYTYQIIGGTQQNLVWNMFYEYKSQTTTKAKPKEILAVEKYPKVIMSYLM